MARFALTLCASALAVAMFSGSLAAHHSFAAFDRTKTQTWEGVITDVKWKNPHSWLYVEVVDEKSAKTTWGFESVSPAQFAQRVKPSVLKVGLKIKITGNPGRIPSEHIGVLEQFTIDGVTYYPLRAVGRERGETQ
jgi:hypothetical protein